MVSIRNYRTASAKQNKENDPDPISRCIISKIKYITLRFPPGAKFRGNFKVNNLKHNRSSESCCSHHFSDWTRWLDHLSQIISTSLLCTLNNNNNNNNNNNKKQLFKIRFMLFPHDFQLPNHPSLTSSDYWDSPFFLSSFLSFFLPFFLSFFR